VSGGSDGVFYPVLTDQIGSPRVVLDPSSGASRWEWEAFGYQAPNENPGSAGVFKFDARFPGQWFDPETGLFQNGYRDYDPRTGRYVQSDPIGLGGGWNTYAYVGGQVTGAVDPYGLDFWGKCLAQQYEARYGDPITAWLKIRKHRDSSQKVIEGTPSEAIRNAEHYLFAKKEVFFSPGKLASAPMMLASMVYGVLKLSANDLETAGLINSPWTYSRPTIDETEAGIEGARDALDELGATEPSSCGCKGQK
jgi:RHS repeat-associated protein